MFIVQISDLHVVFRGKKLSRRVDTAGHLRLAVEKIMRLDPLPHAVIASGDLVEHGHPDEYSLLRELLAPLSMPVYAIPGNHDHREALRAAFADCAWMPRSGFIQYVVNVGELRLIALDTWVEREPYGELCTERLAWLEARLREAPRQPTIVFLHHPPIDSGLAEMDGMRLRNGAELAALMARHPQVERVTCGHLHLSLATRWAGTILSVCPSTSEQMLQNYGPGNRLGTVAEPPAFLLHRWQPGNGLVSANVLVGEFPGPYFYD